MIRQRTYGLAVAIVSTASLAPGQSAASVKPRAFPVTHTTDTVWARERVNFRTLDGIVRLNVVSIAEAMPADKYGFAPTVGEFKNVRTFGKQLKHLAATNFILAAASLGQDPPADAGDEAGPDSVITKQQTIAYVHARSTP